MIYYMRMLKNYIPRTTVSLKKCLTAHLFVEMAQEINLCVNNWGCAGEVSKCYYY